MILYDVIWVLSFGYIWQSIDQLGLIWHVTSYDKPAFLNLTSFRAEVIVLVFPCRVVEHWDSDLWWQNVSKVTHIYISNSLSLNRTWVVDLGWGSAIAGSHGIKLLRSFLLWSKENQGRIMYPDDQPYALPLPVAIQIVGSLESLGIGRNFRALATELVRTSSLTFTDSHGTLLF